VPLLRTSLERKRPGVVEYTGSPTHHLYLCSLLQEPLPSRGGRLGVLTLPRTHQKYIITEKQISRRTKHFCRTSDKIVWFGMLSGLRECKGREMKYKDPMCFPTHRVPYTALRRAETHEVLIFVHEAKTGLQAVGTCEQALMTAHACTEGK
jgi:hypothetical protein